MAQQFDELRKVEEFIEKLYKSGKSYKEIKKELIEKGTPNYIVDRLISIVDSEILADNTNQYKISGKSIKKIKDLLLAQDAWLLVKKHNVFSKSFNLENGELFIIVVQYGFVEGESATIISEFNDDGCFVTVIPPLIENVIFLISKKIYKMLQKIANENKWKFEQIGVKKELPIA